VKVSAVTLAEIANFDGAWDKHALVLVQYARVRDWVVRCAGKGERMKTVNIRYIVDDVDAAIAFYTTHLGFKVISTTLPAFADVALGDLRLLLSGPTSSAGRAMPDGRRPAPGGWNPST
jgi:hypothetical protein